MSAPSLSVSAVSQNSITLASDYAYQPGMAVEVRVSQSLNVTSSSSSILLPYRSDKKIVLSDLRANQTYVFDAQFILGSSKSERTHAVVAATEDYGATSNEEKLRWIRKRIEVLRSALSNNDSLSNVSIDGISETWVSRSDLLKELSSLEAEESRLINGGGRIRRIDMRMVR